MLKKYYSLKEVTKRKYFEEANKKKDTNRDINYVSWNKYFMGIAILASTRSKDPVCQVGACICKNNKILSTGYNGFPNGIDDNKYNSSSSLTSGLPSEYDKSSLLDNW